MKNKFVLASLTAIALTALAACGSTVQGAAVGGGGASSASAPVPPSDITSGGDTTGEETTPDDTTAETTAETTLDETTDETTAETTLEETTEEETTADETTDEETDTPVGGDCAGLIELVQEFNEKILTKASSGSITQADVDSVFSEENVAKIPEAFQEDVATMKELSNQMVGKEPQDLIDPLQKISELYQGLADKLQTECG